MLVKTVGAGSRLAALGVVRWGGESVVDLPTSGLLGRLSGGGADGGLSTEGVLVLGGGASYGVDWFGVSNQYV